VLPRLEPGQRDTPRCIASVECSDLRPCTANSGESRRLLGSAPACYSPDAWRRSPARSTLPASFTTMASDARRMARHRKATMSSHLDRRRAGPSRCRSGGWRVTSLRRRSAQNGRAEEPYRRRGPLAGRTNRSQAPDPTHPRHPRWLLLLHCRVATPTDRQPRHRPQGSALQRDPPALSSDAGVSQLINHRFMPDACDPAKERQRAVTSAGMPCADQC
jgi:hypothetical protein